MLFRFDPFDQFDRLDQKRPMLAMDAVRDDDTVYVYFDAPGVDRDDVELSVERNAVTVEASRRWFDSDQTTLVRERPQGVFKRQIQLGDNLDTEQIDASLDAGVLTLTIPVKEGSRARTIDIRTVSRVPAERELAASTN